MRYIETIAIQEQPKPLDLTKPEEAAKYVNNILLQGIGNAIIMFFKFFWPLPLFIVLIYISKYLLASRIKGKIGERRTRKSIQKISHTTKNILQNEMITLNDIMIPDNEGGTTQIDHIILTVHGIFVIETKNISGWIFGKTKDDFWTIKNYHSTTKMQNPFRQNYKHIMCLSKLINLNSNYFVNVVMLRGDCEVKTKKQMPFELATNESELEEIINSREKFMLSQEELKKIQDFIMDHAIPNTSENRKNHIAYCQNMHE